MLTFLFHRHLEEDENLIAVVHKHRVLLVRALTPPVCALLLIGAVAYQAPFRPVLILSAAVSVGLLVWSLRCFLDEFLDAWILTDQAVVAVTWQGFLHRKSTRIVLSDIQGVTYEVTGLLGTMFRYGTVTIEKISTGATVMLTEVPKPRAVVGAILRQQEAYLHTKNLKDSRAVQELLAQIVAEKVQLNELQQR